MITVFFISEIIKLINSNTKLEIDNINSKFLGRNFNKSAFSPD
jgi:hypothetical protein